MTKCSTKYCRNDSELSVIGKPMCWACWEKLCDDKRAMQKVTDNIVIINGVGHYAEPVMCRLCNEREAPEGLDICLLCDKLQYDAWAEAQEGELK